MFTLRSDALFWIARAELHLCSCGKPLRFYLITPAGVKIEHPLGQPLDPGRYERLPGYGVKILREGIEAEIRFD